MEWRVEGVCGGETGRVLSPEYPITMGSGEMNVDAKEYQILLGLRIGCEV